MNVLSISYEVTWQEICQDKKRQDIFEKMCYKNWYNRGRKCKQANGYTFLQAIETAGGKPADFLLLHFIFQSAIIRATSSGDVVMWI